jgi:pilus assembly protein CpaE
MHADMLNVSILYGNGAPNPALLEVVRTLSQVQLVGQSQNPEDFLGPGQKSASDLVMVCMNGDHSLPPWLESLTTNLPQTAVVLCSASSDPDFLLKAMRQGVREVMPLPLNHKELEDALGRILASKKRLSGLSSHRGKLVTVTGNKGGAGATTIAVNLSMALAQGQTDKVILVDLGRQYPDVGNFLAREAMYTVFDLIQNQASLDHTFLEKTVQPYEANLSLMHGISDFNDQDGINRKGLHKVLNLLKTHYRWVVVDLSYWLDELFVQVVKDSDLVLMLMECSGPELRNLGHLWPLLRKWLPGQDKIKLVLNRYECDHGLSLGNLEQVLKQKPYYTLPSDHEYVNAASNRAVPLVNVAPESRLWSSLKGLAGQLQGDLPHSHDLREGKSRHGVWVI